MAQEAVRSNYNDIGAFVMERIYAAGFLSLQGSQATQRLIDAGQLLETERVLEIGSGLGGPALHIGDTVGCEVVGVDIVETSVVQANIAARNAGLSQRVQFVVGDALALPIEAHSVDAIIGQDAWCHVPEKMRFIGALPGVLRSDSGRLVFSDWLVDDGLPPSAVETIGEVTASPQIATESGYRTYLGAAAFNRVETEDLTHAFAEEYRAVLERLSGLQDEMSSRFSPKVFDIVYGKHEFIAERFARGEMRGVLFVARP